MQTDKVSLLGSEALQIGEAGEFDYSGTQAIKALKEEGRKVILVNPNIATIQTSRELVDRVYFLPVSADFVARIIEKEKPEGILLSFGGQTALNCGIALHRQEILKKHNVHILGSPIEAIFSTEDRALFANSITSLGLKVARGCSATTVKEAIAIAHGIGYPVMIRAGYALGGSGSGVVRNEVQLTNLLENAFSLTTQVIIEESLWGWKEIEYEVVRDRLNNCVTVCNMENMDPVGIHTGESIVVAPSQTLSNDDYFRLRDISIQVIKHLKIIGECNIQFALNPHSNDYRIIEVNARLSRSSALASKATGYPLAYIACKLALGNTLPEIKNSITGSTSAFFEPALDYLVVKMPRWDLDKFSHTTNVIGSDMQSVGEVMSIGRNFPEAIQKAARMLNDGYKGVLDKEFNHQKKSTLLKQLKNPTTIRLFTICSALLVGITVKQIAKYTSIDLWFLGQLAQIVDVYKELQIMPLSRTMFIKAKQFGFSDEQIGQVKELSEEKVRKLRQKYKILPFIKQIDTLAGEFPARTNYLYLTYHGSSSDYQPKYNKKTIVIGSGPYAIGTSVEFDWCAVNTVNSLRRLGHKTIMLNCNPETVSTDYDYCDSLYFEELTRERVLDICEIEKAPVVLSVGGQIPNNLGAFLAKHQVPILGTQSNYIERAENRQYFSRLLDKLHIAQPRWQKAFSKTQTLKSAIKLGFPLLIRPSFVLSGKAMVVVETVNQLEDYLNDLQLDLEAHPLVMTQYIYGGTECDVDGVAGHGQVIVSFISEHIEPPGVHSGDASLIFPPHILSPETQKEIIAITKIIVSALEIHGPFNVQFIVAEDTIYVIECNVRASRSFPFVSKVSGVNLIELATKVVMGKKITKLKSIKFKHVGVKVPQFSFRKIKGADPILKVEMSSTGEVAAFGNSAHEAYLTALLGTGIKYPIKNSVFISLGGARVKSAFLRHIKRLVDLKFTIYSTVGTAFFLKEQHIPVERVGKLHENVHPNFLDLLKNQQFAFAVVIPENYTETLSWKYKQSISDGFMMRRTAIDMGIPVFTTLRLAEFFVESIFQYSPDTLTVKSWNEYSVLNYGGSI